MYNTRKWLNKKNSMSSGSVFIYEGKYPYNGSKLVDSKFIEISDCHSKVRLHKSFADSDKDWEYKVDRLIKELIKYRDYMDNK